MHTAPGPSRRGPGMTLYIHVLSDLISLRRTLLHSKPFAMADDEVDRLLARAKSALEEGEAREVAESLEKVSRTHLLPNFWRVQPTNDRRWFSTTNWTRIRKGDASGDS